MSKADLPVLVIEDTAEYWLGQVEAVASMERCRRLTRAQGMKAVHEVLNRRRIQKERTQRIISQLNTPTA